MSELIKRSKKWRYFVNQAGTVMPQIDIREASSKIASLGPRNDSIFSMNVSTVQSRFSDTLFSDKSRISDNFAEDHFFST